MAVGRMKQNTHRLYESKKTGLLSQLPASPQAQRETLCQGSKREGDVTERCEMKRTAGKSIAACDSSVGDAKMGSLWLLSSQDGRTGQLQANEKACEGGWQPF